MCLYFLLTKFIKNLTYEMIQKALTSCVKFCLSDKGGVSYNNLGMYHIQSKQKKQII